MKSGRSGALKSGKLGLSCKANTCSDARIGEFGVLPTHETSLKMYSTQLIEIPNAPERTHRQCVVRQENIKTRGLIFVCNE